MIGNTTTATNIVCMFDKNKRHHLLLINILITIISIIAFFVFVIANIRITQMLILFGAICLISITGVASSTDENLSQTSQCIQPINYTISLEIHKIKLTVMSTVVLNVSCEQQYIRLQLGRHCNVEEVYFQTANFYNLSSSHWTAIQSNNIKTRFKSVDISLIDKNRSSKTLILRKEQKSTLKSGIYIVHSMYKCTLKKVVTVDTYISQTETKEFLILSRIPNKWIFPYWKNPATKAKFTIQIIHKCITDKALSNMPKYQTLEYQIRKFRTVFFTTPLISTHLVAFIVIPSGYKTNTTSKSNVTITSSLEMKNNTDYARTLIVNITKRIRNMWDDIIPRLHVSYVLLSITSTQYESIGSPGFVFLSEVNSIYNSEVDSIIKERKVTCFIARNVLQEIFSDWLATFEQSNSWFLEGFLTVYGVYIWDESLLKSIVVQTRRNILDYIEAFSKNDFPIQESPSIGRNSTLRKMWREKGFSTFYMLNNCVRDILYDSMFKEAVHSYYITDNTSTNAYNKLSILDKLWYWNFEESFNISTLYFSTTEIRRIITSWTTQIGYPALQVKRHNNKQDLIVTVKDCFDIDHKMPCKLKSWIPVIFYQILDSEVIATSFISLYANETNVVTSLYSESVFTAIVDSAGYRVNYDRQSWKHIACFLKNIESVSAELSDVTLAQILDDAFYFLVQTTKYNENPASDDLYIYLTDIDIYLELASSIFHVKNSYIAWYPIFIALENISKIFPFSDSVVSNIKDKLLDILNRFLDNISLYTHSSKTVTKHFYHEVLKWICILDDFKCNEHVKGILKWHVKHPAQNQLLPSWQKWIYCRGLMLETYEESALTQTLFNIYQTQGRKEEFFEVLPCFRRYKTLLSFLYFLDQNSLLQSIKNDVKKSVTVSLLFNIIALYSKTESAIGIILSKRELENTLGIKLVREVNILAIINCVINNIYSEDGLSMVTNEEFLNKLLDINYMEPFVLDIITKKTENRRRNLVKMQKTIRFK